MKSFALRGRYRIIREFTSSLLVTALALGTPGSLGVAWAAPESTEASALTVSSEPVGASVYLDGDLQGQTPLSLDAVSRGDHRVSVVKDGFLENSRVVSVRPGQPGSVQVKLTPQTDATAPRFQVEPSQPKAQKKGGGGKKWVIIGLGAAAGAAAFVILTKNSPPVAGTIGVSPSGTGMAGITTFTFTSQGASDPDKDPLTYEWAFGDGATGSGQSTTHVYAAPGSFSASLTVADKKHKVTAPGTTVTVARSMSGTWTGGVQPGFNSSASVNLNQSGTSLSGSITYSGGLRGTVSGLTGTVSGTTYPATVTFSTPIYGISGTGCGVRDSFSGTADSSGNSMSGTSTTTLFSCFFTATGSSTATGQSTFRR